MSAFRNSGSERTNSCSRKWERKLGFSILTFIPLDLSILLVFRSFRGDTLFVVVQSKRFPIVEVHFHKYRVNGHIMRLDHGDHHAGKGVGFARIRVSKDRLVSVFNTHTIAAYSAQDDIYYADRLSQMWELGRLVHMMTSREESLVVVCGDLNCGAHSLEYRLFTSVASGLEDAYTSLHDDEGYTHEDLVHQRPKRLDYIFHNRSRFWKLEECEVTLKNHVKFYSDHFGVKATFRGVDGDSVAASGSPKTSGGLKLPSSSHRAR